MKGLASGRKQIHFPTMVIARNRLTGSLYGCVYEYGDFLMCKTSTAGGNLICLYRTYVEILLPDLVRPFDEQMFRNKTLLSSYNDKKKAGNPFGGSAGLSTVNRERLDQFVKGYVPVRAFVNYDEFLDGLIKLIKGNQ